MAGKQKQWLADVLAAEDEALPSPAPDFRSDRAGGTTLLGRESALARVASGEVRQVTQLLLNPARVRIWPGNARIYSNLTEANVRELIDSIIAEGGQKMPAVVRRVEGDPLHDYEVIAGTRRHFAISWLRANSYPDMLFVAQVAQLDDEAAFRLADLENRARQDVSDLERARNYASALTSHYGGLQSRMAQRLNLSEGWLSKMLKVATIPDAILAAFASPDDVQLKPAYKLYQMLRDKEAAKAISAAARVLAKSQAERRAAGQAPYPAAEVLQRLLDAPFAAQEKPQPYRAQSRFGRTMLTVQSVSRQGLTVKLHTGAGADTEEVVEALRSMLLHVEATAGITLK